MSNATSPITLNIVHDTIDSVSAFDLDNVFLVNFHKSTVKINVDLSWLRSCKNKTILRQIFPQNQAVSDDTSLEFNEHIGSTNQMKSTSGSLDGWSATADNFFYLFLTLFQHVESSFPARDSSHKCKHFLQTLF